MHPNFFQRQYMTLTEDPHCLVCMVGLSMNERVTKVAVVQKGEGDQRLSELVKHVMV